MAHSPIADLLAKVGLLDERQIDAVMSRVSSGNGGKVLLQVAEMGYASESAVARAISIELGLPRIDLSLTPPEPEALALLEGHICVERLLLPVALRENGELLWLAMADPTDGEAVTFVRRKTGKRVRPAVAGPSEIVRTARAAYNVQMPRISSAHGEEDLGAIDIAEISGEHDQLEVVNVMDESASPLARIARQLGIEVPDKFPSAGSVDVPELTSADGAPPTARPEGRPRKLPFEPATPPPVEEEEEEEVELVEAMHTGPIQADPDRDELTHDELATLEAIRGSMEKSAIVLRAIVTLCLEKGLFTKEEMARRRR